MSRIYDKTVLLLIGCINLIGMDSYMIPVVTLLLAVIAAAFGVIFEENDKVWLISVVYLAMCIFVPELSYFLPLIVYDCFTHKFIPEVVISLVLLIYSRSCYSNIEIIVWLIAFILSFILENRTSKIIKLEKELIKLRDTSTELTLVLKEKNKDLMDKQDYEVHLATLRERNRIAREIHDNVGHMLSRTILQVGALLAINKDEWLKEHLESIKDTLNTAMSNIRESVHDLHDDSIDLKQSVKEVLKVLEDSYNVKLDYDMSEGVSRNIKYCFISTIKEAVSNIIKHSNADKVTIVMREHPAFYQLLIEDNGKVSNHSLTGGIGLENMKERIDAFNGTIRFDTQKGFKIFISIKKEDEGKCV